MSSEPFSLAYKLLSENLFRIETFIESWVFAKFAWKKSKGLFEQKFCWSERCQLIKAMKKLKLWKRLNN